jgi:hypothetical protein
LEIKLNKIFAIYTRAYYSSSAINSVYVWELGEKIQDGFCVVILIKHKADSQKELDQGCWDSSNFVTVNFRGDENYNLIVEYKLTTTVILKLSTHNKICGNIDLSGSLTRQVI